MFSSLRFRFWSSSLSLAICPLLVAGFVVGKLTIKNIEQTSLTIQREIIERVESEIWALVEGCERELLLLDRVVRFDLLAQEQQRAVLQSILTSRAAYQELVLIDRDGAELIRLSRAKSYARTELKSRSRNDEYLHPILRNETYLGPMRFDAGIHEPLATLSIPIFDSRHRLIKFVLIAELRLGTIWQLLSASDFLENYDVYVADQTGRVAAHRNPVLVLSETMIDLSGPVGRGIGLSGLDVLTARDTVQVKNQKLIVISEQPIKTLRAPMRQSMVIIIIIFSVALGLAILLALTSTHRIAVPILAMAKKARSIAAGEHTGRPGDGKSDAGNAGRQDEIGGLSRSINAMTHELLEREDTYKSQIAELQQARTELERLLETRTDKIRAAEKQFQKEAELRRTAEQSLRDAEESKRAYLDVAEVMLIALDGNGIILDINRKGCEVLGQKREEIVRHDWFLEYISEVTREDCRAGFKDLIGGRTEATKDSVSEIVTAQRVSKAVEWRQTAIFGQSGAVDGVLMSGRDISEIKRMEEEILKARKLEDFGALAGVIAQEYGAILASATGNEDVTNLPEFEKGNASLREITSMEEVARKATEHILDGSNVKYEIITIDGIKLVLIDKEQICRSIENIVSNAKQAMPGGGTIRLRFHNTTFKDGQPPLTPGEYVKLSIEDTGIGIKRDDQQRIFDPDYSTWGARRGLGLAIARSIVRQHDGTITVESEEDRGTTFTLFLPAVARK